MLDIENWVSRLEVWLDWAPDWVVGLALLIAAAAVARGISMTVLQLVKRFLAGKSPFLRTLIDKISGPLRLALLIFVVRAALAVAPFRESDADIIGHLLLLGLVALIGWAAVTALDLAATLWLRQYRLDVEDNLLARKHFTQIRMLRRIGSILIVTVTISAALMTFDGVRQYGVSLLASAGAAGLVVGLAAQPVLSNIIAGIQLAITQPIRIEDAVVVEGEWGWIEDITATYVVVRLWDWRRLVVPLKHFIEKPFQNWTREGGSIIGSVFLHVDYTISVPAVRQKLQEVVEQSTLWDRKVVNLQVTDAHERTIVLRALVSAGTSPRAWDLRCEVREKLIDFLQREHPAALPKQRADVGWQGATDDRALQSSDFDGAAVPFARARAT